MSKLITVRIDEQLLGALDVIAQGTGKTRSDVIRDALLAYAGPPSREDDVRALLQELLERVEALEARGYVPPGITATARESGDIETARDLVEFVESWLGS